MPELPEVETIRRDLVAGLLHRKITSVDILSAKTASPAAVFFTRNLNGRKIVGVGRRGKLLIFSLSPLSAKSAGRGKPSTDYLLIHLKMTGQLIYVDSKAKIAGGHGSEIVGELPNKHTRAVIGFASGGRLFFNDLRRFGYLKLATATELSRLLKNNYGPEPLTVSFSLSFLKTVLKNKKTKIKALLLNQKLIAGLGNIYVDESLWAARIDPERPAGSLTGSEIKKLHRVINQVIRRAIKYRGTTFNNYVDSRGQKGNFFRFLKVYGRKGEKCPNCGRPIKKKKVAGRGTHYCPACQK